MSPVHDPLLCILPPHLLRNIIEKGSEKQRDFALHTLSLSEQFRGHRQAFTTLVELATTPATTSKKIKRTIYSARNGSALPGTVVRKEGGKASTDVAVNEAFDASGATWNFYKNAYNRLSVDDKNMPLNSTVHYEKNYDNAFWNGQQMVYGDGDGQLFNRFTISVDVIGHELTHGVTQFTAQLNYSQQSGALNESFSDVFGSLVKQYQRKQSAAQADWLIGAGLLAPKVKGVALRSMKAPGTAYDDPVLGKDPQPTTMKGYVKTSSDNGGVHINSGIPNHAFYVVAINIGGNAWEKAGLIWYLTLRDKLKTNANFQTCANLTYQVAGEQFGKGSLEQKAVQAGWAEVGIKVSTTIKAKAK